MYHQIYIYTFFQSIVDNSDEKMSSSEDVQTPESISAMERALLLALSLKWRKQSDSLNAEQCRDLEREIWLSHIQSAMNEIDKPVSGFVMGQLILTTMHDGTVSIMGLSVNADGISSPLTCDNGII